MRPYGLNRNDVAYCRCCNRYPVGRWIKHRKTRKDNKRLPHKRARASLRRETVKEAEEA